MDTFYTPREIATLMVKHIKQKTVGPIADFCAGDGGLLRAAASRFPKATFIATDVDRLVVSRLRRRHSHWRIGYCDFLTDSSRDRCRALKAIAGRCSVVLLNPPFSYRGGAHWSGQIAGQYFQCSQAMAFLVKATTMLAVNGQIIAIMPIGSFQSNKDETAWKTINQFFQVQVLSEHDKWTFDGCCPRTALVRLIRKPLNDVTNPLSICTITANNLRAVGPAIIKVQLVRGWVQMHTITLRSGRVLPLIHSKDLTAHVVRSGERRVRSIRKIRGPAVLLPRVGQPSLNNLCVLSEKTPVALSDCVIALQTEGINEARHLHILLKESWSAIEKLYGGTCARYVTLKRLREGLNLLGVCEAASIKELAATQAA